MNCAALQGGDKELLFALLALAKQFFGLKPNVIKLSLREATFW